MISAAIEQPTEQRTNATRDRALNNLPPQIQEDSGWSVCPKGMKKTASSMRCGARRVEAKR
ncbi:hypothetical protein MES4922_110203 [Mesorhizobium ventifaucium]|uniref:Uncharacterized protein n=1 Tax=Mesorhizobium ventifaucium TaxID=666020 RepID=A0ABN8JCC9_9HYPH|nr:hypothetical protein MES4922_110203 [Mesorhizobium ventifaucium]